MSEAKVMNGAKLAVWQEVDWKTVNEDVNNLRQRIFVASKENDLKKVGNLQKLMLRSRANWLMSIRRVTQMNKGRKTAGVDGEVITTGEERVELFYWLENITLNEWKPPPTRRVEIPKGDGKTRPLGIPTIRDRIIQAIVKNALEPFWEARFEATSYGFRPGRSTHDAVCDVWMSTRSTGKRQSVLDADIKGAFDNIDHDKLMEVIGMFPARFLIRKWLKAGVMVNLDMNPTEAGTPQGGIISPLLANIALHGMEEAVGVKKKYGIVRGELRPRYRGTIKVIRYADDFVVLTETKAQAKEAKERLEGWLAERGLTLSARKTQITTLTEGFDFLGFTIKMRKNAMSKRGFAVHTYPSKKSIERFKGKVRGIVRKHREGNPQNIITELNPLIVGWGVYYRTGVSHRTYNKLDHFIWQAIWKWARRRHPNKGRSWVHKKYYRKVDGYTWTLVGENEKPLKRMSAIPIRRHRKVADLNSPDDPELIIYWAIRRKANNPFLGVRADLYKIQEGKCDMCEGWLEDDEAVHLHHSDGNNQNWKRSNLSLVHETCHHQHHSKKRSDA